ncbi:WD40 repeat domain-containing protein [Streptomyces sp. NPDC002599]|uniref:WD40 repeat domain-containing protein n=1 Tax=Streptomyces sp. NPDC002599 TaxID=3154421 RepID=UPI00332BDC62
MPAQVCWPDTRHGIPPRDALDMALLWLERPVPTDGSPVRWGRPTGVVPVPFEGAGFPAFAAETGSSEQCEYLRGDLPAVSTSSTGWVLDCPVWPAPRRERQRPWAGASGSAVFCHGRLVGVAAEDNQAMDWRRLHAVPVHEALNLPGFADLALRHGHPGTTTALEKVTASNRATPLDGHQALKPPTASPATPGRASRGPQHYRLLASLNESDPQTEMVAFSPDGTLAAGNHDGTVWLWDSATRQLDGEPIAAHTDKVFMLVFSRDGTLLATSGGDKTVRLWDPVTHRPVGDPITDDGNVFGLAFSPDVTLLATTSRSGETWLWDPTTRREAGEPLSAHRGTQGVAFSPDGTLLATASYDKTVQLWDRTSRQPLGEPITGHTDQVFVVEFSPDGRLLATASSDRTARLWNRGTRKPVGFPLTHPGGGVLDIAFSPDGTMLATAGGDATVRLWDAATGRPAGPALTHRYRVNAVAFSPDGTLLATSDGTVHLWQRTNLALSRGGVSEA